MFNPFALRSVALMNRAAAAPASPEEPLIVGPENFDLTDDFETPQILTTMVGRANWSGTLTNFVTENGVARYNQLYGPKHIIFFGNEINGDVDVELDFKTDGTDPIGEGWRGVEFYVWYIDEDNNVSVSLDPQNNRVVFKPRMNGSEQLQTAGSSFGTNPFPGAKNSVKFRIQVTDGALRMWVDGLTIRKQQLTAPFDYFDLRNFITDTAKQKGKLAIQRGTYRQPFLNGVSLRAGKVTCTIIDGAVGLDAVGGSVGTVTYTGKFTGTPVKWVSRLLDANDRKTVLRGWHEVTASISGSTYSIAEAMPIGGPYVVEHGYLDAQGLRTTSLSKTTMVGHRIISFGQSTSEGRGGGTQNDFAALPKGAFPERKYNDFPDIPYGYMINGRDDFRYSKNDNHWGFTDAFQTNTGVPVLFEAYGRAAAGLDLISAENPTPVEWNKFISAVASRKGVVEAVIWDQGQGDTDGSPTSASNSLATYAARFKSGIVDPLRSLLGNPNLKFFVSHMGRYAGPYLGGVSQAQFDIQRNAHRIMKFAMTTEGGGSDPNIHTSSHHTATVYGDGYHFVGAPAGTGRINERDGFTIAKKLGYPVHDGRGPIPVGMSRSGAVLTIAINLNEATSLSQITDTYNVGTAIIPAQPANRFKGWDFSTSSNFASLLAVTSIVVSGSNLVVTLAADPGATVYARHLYGAGYDDTVLFHGIYSGATYDRTIPVEPTMAANGYLSA